MHRINLPHYLERFGIHDKPYYSMQSVRPRAQATFYVPGSYRNVDKEEKTNIHPASKAGYRRLLPIRQNNNFV